MNDASLNSGKLKFHPSYGWATDSQIERIKTMGISPERDRVFKEIEKQTKERGKKKR